MTASNWVFSHEYGQGCKVYVDKNSILKNGDIVCARIKHYLVPPGTDKRNQKQISEVIFDNQFNIDLNQVCHRSITFIYIDGIVADPLATEPNWAVAEKGALTELNFIRSLVSSRRKRWWPF